MEPLEITIEIKEGLGFDPCDLMYCDACPIRCRPEEFKRAVEERGMIVTIKPLATGESPCSTE